MRRTSSKSAPLSHERLAILLALAATPANGVEVYTAIIGDSVGQTVLKPSSLYRLLRELKDYDYIKKINQDAFCLTPKGWKTLEREATRTDRWTQIAQQRLARQRYGARP